MISLSNRLRFPDDIVTQTIGILAKRRAGKSYTARRFTEQIVESGQQVVIVDPKGDWWGIRSSSNGKAKGLPVTILGGERGDVPLEKAGGPLPVSPGTKGGDELNEERCTEVLGSGTTAETRKQDAPETD